MGRLLLTASGAYDERYGTRLVSGARAAALPPGDYRRHPARPGISAQYYGHRPRQSLSQRHPGAAAATVPVVVGLDERRIKCGPVLGGLIHEYHKAA
jgi:hypothetical protein